MSKPSVLVVEDEPLIADDIASILEKNGYDVVDIVDEVVDAFASIKKYNPDIALLDINIEGDEDGIDLAERLNVPFVFLTSYYDQNTLDRAKKTNPSGYIVKPFNEKDLIANVEIALSRTRKNKAKVDSPEKLFLRNGQEIVSVMSSDIVYVEAFDNYANVFTATEKFIISHTLKSIEEKLLPFGFIRVHRSYLINFAHVDSLSEGYVFLKGHKVQIGKSYRKEFIDGLSML
ncbi:response regulator [Reichenbachiella carrageenanivorans]|uniref:Response regulator n=1 Tax=Reichenbachiella carrageenanivorans TaxID=2979869 RepID=A0ABY6D239_9BACT|nr:LytTR family transcriptional regulator DNA-binding domain-containing protein [Reichenbachiella carrageenanivorans]UXX80230.1 response regulator [Reichenbachiella carrageenanivorans]